MKISQLVVRIIGIVLGVAMMIVGIAGLSGALVNGVTSPGTNAPYSAKYGADFYTDTAEYLEIIGNNTDAIAENTRWLVWGLESLSCQIGAICLVAGLLIVVIFVDKLLGGLPIKREPKPQKPAYMPPQQMPMYPPQQPYQQQYYQNQAPQYQQPTPPQAQAQPAQPAQPTQPAQQNNDQDKYW